MKKANTYLLYSGLCQMVQDEQKAPRYESYGPKDYSFYEALDNKLGLVDPEEQKFERKMMEFNPKLLKEVIEYKKYLNKCRRKFTEFKIEKRFNLSREQARLYMIEALDKIKLERLQKC